MRSRKNSAPDVANLLSQEWQVRIRKGHVPRICKCLSMLSDHEIWWRPNAASNSIGNLILHLCGNVQQWVVSGLGGEPDRRERDLEFAERGSVPSKELARRLTQTATEAGRVIASLTVEDVMREYEIQGFAVSGFTAATTAISHFCYHAGQILYVTKLKQGKDLKFTKLPAARSKGKRTRLWPSDVLVKLA